MAKQVRRFYPQIFSDDLTFNAMARGQRTRMGLTLEDIANRSGVPLATVTKALQPDALITPAVAVQLAVPLDIDVAHAALLSTRDQLARRERAEDEATESPSEARKCALSELSAALSFQENARHVARGTGRRLAFRAFRRGWLAPDGGASDRRQVSRQDVAAKLAESRGQETPSPAARELFLYEHDRIGGDCLPEYLEALSQSIGHTVTLQDLDDFASGLSQIHILRDTSEDADLRDRKQQRVEGPPGHGLRLQRSATFWGSITIERLTHSMPKGVTSGDVRVINARHDFLEIATVVSGEVELIQTSGPIDSWEQLTTEHPDSMADAGPTILRRTIIGAGGTVVFSSQDFHHAELRSSNGSASVVSVNIGGNVWLHRRLRALSAK